MKKFLVAGVLGLMTMFAVGTQTATAASWRGAYRGHSYGYGHAGYRSVERFHTVGRPYSGFGGYGYGYGHYRGCW